MRSTTLRFTANNKNRDYIEREREREGKEKERNSE